jgi:V/A-type H+/Na+-transporting ATPase subunit I
MIAPMKHVFIIVMEREKETAVRALRKLGVIHPEPLEGHGATFEQLSNAKIRVEKACSLLSDFKVKQASLAFNLGEAVTFSEQVIAMNEAIKSINDAIIAKTTEIERIQTWGDFDPALFAGLADDGIALRLVEIPSKKLDSLPEDLDYILIANLKGQSRILLLARRDLELPEDTLEFIPSDRSLGQHQKELGELRQQAAAKRTELTEYASRANALQTALRALEAQITFEKLSSGMDNDGPVSWFAGWIPEKDEAALRETAAREGWGLLIDEPLQDEMPPTKIENPAAIRMVQPIFDFLGTVPNYREYDISGLFLFFFAFFFAIIFGDGGYGSLLFLAGLFLLIRERRAGKQASQGIRLLLFMSGATVVWGVLTGTWFGIDWNSLPDILRQITVPWIANGNPEAGENIKVLCFVIGLTQLGIAHVKNFLRDWPSPRLIAQIGQIGMLAGIFFLVLNLVISPARFPLPEWAPASIGIGFALNFLFANFDDSSSLPRGFIKGVLDSLKNIVPVLLGVVNIFADVVSYIRLWAVGLAGLAISQTVNNMAGPLLGSFVLFAGGVFLLLFGHGLNLVMALLSVIVHGVRLNMLEFSSHLGMEWSGYKYEPFADPAANKQG